MFFIRHMITGQTMGRTRTAVGYERFARPSEMYVTHMISQGLTKILPPQDSLESFKGWCTWMHVGYWGVALELKQ